MCFGGSSDKETSYTPKSSHSANYSSEHTWRYEGQNEKAAASGDKYPNKYYRCSRCNEYIVDRGDGIKTTNHCK